jgi:hypothetical protein
MTAHTNQGKTSSAKRNSNRKPKLRERDRLPEKGLCLKIPEQLRHKVTAKLNIRLEDPFPQKKSDVSFTNPTFTLELQSLNLLLLKTTLKGEKQGVMITKPERLMTVNT